MSFGDPPPSDDTSLYPEPPRFLRPEEEDEGEEDETPSQVPNCKPNIVDSGNSKFEYESKISGESDSFKITIRSISGYTLEGRKRSKEFDYYIEFDLQNKTIYDLENTRISLEENDFDQSGEFVSVENFSASGKVRLILSVIVKSKNILDLGREYTFILESFGSGRSIKERITMEREIRHIAIETVKNFYPQNIKGFDEKEHPPGHYYLGVFGKAGHGKSSTINSFLTLLSREKEVERYIQCGGGSDNVTTKIEHHCFLPEVFDCLDERDRFNMRFIDCWGVLNDNYGEVDEHVKRSFEDKIFRLRKYLEGKLPPDWEMRRKRNEGGVKSVGDYRPHCIIFFVTYRGIDRMMSGGDDTKKFFQEIHKEVNNPIVVITKPDEFVTEMKDDVSRVPSEARKRRREVAEFFDIGIGDVFFGRNYVFGTGKADVNTDLNNFKILYKALRRAKTNYKKQASKTRKEQLSISTNCNVL